jgi:hypothetical protein
MRAASDLQSETSCERSQVKPNGPNPVRLLFKLNMHFIKIKSRTVVGRKNSVCGTSTDGPYQAYEFGFTIQEETGRHRIPEELRFCQAVIWDATHLLNLAATDIKEGKFGEFFTNFIKRANYFNHMMGTGKGFAQLELSSVQNEHLLLSRLPLNAS